MVDQATLPDDVKRKMEVMTEKVKELKELETTSVAGIPCFKTEDVQPEWDSVLDEAMFRIMGFSVFLGALAHQCRYSWTLSIPTAAAQTANGKFYIYINPVFFIDFLESGAYQAFVVVHETYHIFYEHTDRCKEVNYDPEIWNLACDYFLHNDMDDMINDPSCVGKGTIKMIPQDVFPICFDKERFGGMTEDEIYKVIEEENDDDEENEEGEGQGEGEGEEGDGQGSPESGSGKGKSFNGQYSFDSSPSNADDPLSDTGNTTKDAVARAVSSAAATALNQGGNEIGAAEANLIRRFMEIHEPKVDWKSELAEYFEKIRSCDLTYSNFNRRSNEQVIFPSKTGEYVRVFFGVDTSGSMSDEELTEAMSELQGILDEIDEWEVTIASCDVGAFEIARLSSQEQDDLKETPIDLRGGGGTELSPMIRMAQEEHDEGDEYHVIVILTDGYVPVQPLVSAHDEEIPVLFVVTGADGNDQSLSEHFNVIKLASI